MDDLVRIDGERVKKLRREKGWTQVRLATELNSAGVGWLRKIEAGKMVRLEWTSNTGLVSAGEDLAAALGVDLDTLILDLLDGERIQQFRDQRKWSRKQLAQRVHVGEKVAERAETGQYVRRVEARALATAFDVPLAELLAKDEVKGLKESVLAGKLHPLLADVNRFLADVGLIVRTWLNEGHEGMDDKLPAHPEFVYRLSGEWTGWSDFLGVTPDQAHWKENLTSDISEECAFQVVQSLAEIERQTKSV